MTPEQPYHKAVSGTEGHHREAPTSSNEPLSQVSEKYEPDRQAMLAALRVVLGPPRVTSPLARPL